MIERLGLLALVCLLSVGCKRGGPDQNRNSKERQPAGEPSSGANNRHPQHAPLANERLEIPTGTLEAGSLPGTEGRRPQVEQLLTKVDLGPFSIDRLLFPNDPAAAAVTNLTRAEAATRCAERSGRLCTELEWERACKGPNNDPYPTGPSFDPECISDGRSCATGFDVLAMGTIMREWTASDAIGEAGMSKGAIVRGARSRDAATEHRCSKREVVKETEHSTELGFRCCYGPPNAARVEEPELKAVFERPRFDADKMVSLLESHPKTKGIAKEWTFFREPDAAETVVTRGPGDRQGLRFTVAPLYWSPVAGTRFLLIVGRSGKETSAILAYHVIRDGDYRLAASFIMKSEPGPVALAYHESIRPRLFFSTCWKCPGETGRLLYRDPDTVAIVQP